METLVMPIWLKALPSSKKSRLCPYATNADANYRSDHALLHALLTQKLIIWFQKVRPLKRRYTDALLLAGSKLSSK
jgi:hypothetical protein